MTLNTSVVASKQQETHRFIKDIEIGTYGEYTLKKYFKRFYPNIQIEDKSDVRAYQLADIDMLLKDGEEVKSIEVKNDRTVFENLFYETVSVRKEGEEDTPGCVILTEADYLVYIYQAIGVAVVARVNNLNNWVVSYLSEPNNVPFRKAIVKNAGYEGEGYRIPVRSLMGEARGVEAVEGIQLVDLNDNVSLTYKEYESRRKDMYEELDESYYSTIKDRSDWEERNKVMYKNKNNLNIPLLDKDVRLKQSRNRLRYLNALYEGTKIIIKSSH